MGCKYICDNCGKEESANWSGDKYTHPYGWFSRYDEKGPQNACCRECAFKVSEKRGTPNLFNPW